MFPMIVVKQNIKVFESTRTFMPSILMHEFDKKTSEFNIVYREHVHQSKTTFKSFITSKGEFVKHYPGAGGRGNARYLIYIYICIYIYTRKTSQNKLRTSSLLNYIFTKVSQFFNIPLQSMTNKLKKNINQKNVHKKTQHCH